MFFVAYFLPVEYFEQNIMGRSTNPTLSNQMCMTLCFFTPPKVLEDQTPGSEGQSITNKGQTLRNNGSKHNIPLHYSACNFQSITRPNKAQ